MKFEYDIYFQSDQYLLVRSFQTFKTYFEIFDGPKLGRHCKFAASSFLNQILFLYHFNFEVLLLIFNFLFKITQFDSINILAF